MINNMTEQSISRLLKERHEKDVFVTGCKTGGSWTNKGHLKILDGWAMVCSWAHPRMIVYEIKTSRADFFHDEKWMTYLKYGNEFYFVVPWKMVAPEEVPDQCGLIYVNKKGNKLYTRKKSAYINVQDFKPIYSLMKYVLMSRAKILPPEGARHPDMEITQQDWANWLNDRGEKTRVGRKIEGIISRRTRKAVGEIQEMNYHLTFENQRLKRELENTKGSGGLSYNQLQQIRQMVGRITTIIGPGDE